MLQEMRVASRYIWIFVFAAFVVGFLLLDTSGLLGGAGSITPQTAVASVEGRDMLYTQWQQASQQLIQQEQQRSSRPLTLDEQRRLEDQAFEEMVTDILLVREYSRRNIRVTDEEIRQYAQFAPPPWITSVPDFQTEGRFDLAKYRRFLGTPQAQQSGILFQIEQYYRRELPRQKLFEQIAAGVYISDAQLWSIWRDERDSAQVSFVAFRPDPAGEAQITVSDAEIRAWYERHRESLERPGRAVVSLVRIPRTVTAADTAAALQRTQRIRSELLLGAPFAEVAVRESADTLSAERGGSLGPTTRGQLVPEFESAAYALRPGGLSQPVLTPFGYHIIRVDERRGDTLSARHILIPLQQSDSAAVATDRRADSLSRLAALADQPARFDTAARTMNLPVQRVVAIQGEPLISEGMYVPSVSAWAFGGAQPGESSDLYESEDGYFLARLDSLHKGGVPSLESVRDEIRRLLAREKAVDALVPQAQRVSEAAASAGGSLETGVRQVGGGLTVERTALFNRVSAVPGIGRLNQAIGAAFALEQGSVSQPVKTPDAVYVLRVERRIDADSAGWEEQKETQRVQLLPRLRQQRVQEFVRGLRDNSSVKDRRQELMAAARVS